MRYRRLSATFLFTSLLVAVVLFVEPRLARQRGLQATYFSTADWTAPSHTRVDPEASIEAMYLGWHSRPPPQFSIRWQGSLVVLRGGVHKFVVTSDDDAELRIDGQPCIELAGAHSARTFTCAIGLASGVHAIDVRYTQRGGDFYLAVDWARGNASPRTLSHVWLAPEPLTLSRWLRDVAWRSALVLAEILWLLAVMAWPFTLARPRVAAFLARLHHDAPLRALTAVIVLSLLFNGIGISAGLGGQEGWLGDEITPTVVLDGIAHRFSDGWWGWYPLVHFYVLTIVYSPVLLLAALGQADLSRGIWYDVLAALSRGVVWLEGAGILVAVYLCGKRLRSAWSGVYGAAALATLVLFVAYSKVSNIEIPYVFWFAVALVFYLRFVESPTARDAALFALAGGLSVTSKDQAYGLFLVTPLVVVARIWKERRANGEAMAIVRSLIDVRVIGAGIVFLAIYAVGNNLFFNYSGTRTRMEFLSSSGARMVADFDMFEAMPARRLGVVAQTVRLAQQSSGWPMFAVGIVAWLSALWHRTTRHFAIALTAVVLGYYVGFINLVMYCYDRFLLPVLVVQAVIAGVWMDRFLAPGVTGLTWRRLGIALVFTYSILYSGMYNALLLRDSRYAVSEWLEARAQRGTVVGVAFVQRLQPDLGRFNVKELSNIPDFLGVRPEYYVFDADYARAVRRDTHLGQLIAGLEDRSLGYEKVLEFRSPTPWGWLPWAHPELAGPRTATMVTSSLGDINPTFAVYQRQPLP